MVASHQDLLTRKNVYKMKLTYGRLHDFLPTKGRLLLLTAIVTLHLIPVAHPFSKMVIEIEVESWDCKSAHP